jgi:hypothetical protein
MTSDATVRRLAGDEAAALAGPLSDLLIDCVEGGASVGFLLPLSRERALSFWRGVADAVARGERVLLIAEDAQGIAGTVQLIVSLPDNQPHRADVAKMLVHRRARRRGIAQSLLVALDEVAAAQDRHVLVLDTVSAIPSAAAMPNASIVAAAGSASEKYQSTH